MNAGFFTRPNQVPHPRLQFRWIALVHDSLVQAFEMLRADRFDLANSEEDCITEKLEKILDHWASRQESGAPDLSFVRSVTRESANSNYDESSKKRKPDLIFRLKRHELYLTHDSRKDSLFAECKPVGRKHPLNKHYCAIGKRMEKSKKNSAIKESKTAGIERFVLGGYAPDMEQGLMIAYVRDGFQITRDLANALQQPKARTGLGEPNELSCVTEASGAHTQGLYLTTHQRLFPWPDGRNATPIDLYHSWHEC